SLTPPNACSILRIMRPSTTREELVDEIDRSNAEICRSQRRMLELIARADERAVWTDSGAMSMSHYVSMRYGVSWWKAERWIRAGHALRSLPRIAGAFERGEIGIDKVLELCRFATPETEAPLRRRGLRRHDTPAGRSRGQAVAGGGRASRARSFGKHLVRRRGNDGRAPRPPAGRR